LPLFDIIYDHFLAKNWTIYHKLPLKTFTHNTYKKIDKYLEILPHDFQYLYQFIKAADWMAGYQDKDTTIFAIRRLAHRFKDPLPLNNCLDYLLPLYPELETIFTEFMTDIIVYCEDIRNQVEFIHH